LGQYVPKLATRLIASTGRSKARGWGGGKACNFVSVVLPEKFLVVAVYRL